MIQYTLGGRVRRTYNPVPWTATANGKLVICRIDAHNVAMPIDVTLRERVKERGGPIASETRTGKCLHPFRDQPKPQVYGQEQKHTAQRQSEEGSLGRIQIIVR